MIKLERLGAAAAVLIVAACNDPAPRTTSEEEEAVVTTPTIAPEMAPDLESTMIEMERGAVTSSAETLELATREAMVAIIAFQNVPIESEVTMDTIMEAGLARDNVESLIPRVRAAIDAANVALQRIGRAGGDDISALRQAIARAEGAIVAAEGIPARYTSAYQGFTGAGGRFPHEGERGEWLRARGLQNF